ncbi:MAG: thioredoxin domain-containing protein [archaeon]|jgi:protein-disulfide isomerase|nr:thioredoxin domain-containing protein [archaeon]
MVICIIALPVFALLGLFSLKYRILAWEAFHCLFRTVAFKPCNTGLDLKIKSKFTAKLMWFPALARGFYKYFAVLSWIFVILALLSVAGTGYGLYNYIKYGNCNGPDSSAFCIFNPTRAGGEEQCSTFTQKTEVDVKKVNLTGAVVRGALYAPYAIVEYGCYSCHYTKEAESALNQVLANYPNVKLFYLDVPLDIHPYSVEAGEAAICAGEQGKYWEYHDLIFERQESLNDSSFRAFANELKLSVSAFDKCLDANSTKAQLEMQRDNAFAAGVYGTPTFIIGKTVLVGPQEYEVLEKAVKKLM